MPSKVLTVGLVWSATIILLPVMYAKFVPTVKVIGAELGLIATADVVADEYLSPAIPVGPVCPIEPVEPIEPVGPVGPSIPSKLTLYFTVEP